MVCEKCEKKKGKLGQVVTPDPWKSNGIKRNVGENKLLTSKKARYNPTTAEFVRCRICKTKVHQVGSRYCQECSYKKGICAMCGIKMLQTKNYKQSSR